MNIWAHTLVKNEEKYLWYSVASVAPFVDKVLLWDTGSTDKTPEICKELINRFPEKIDFRQVKQEGADDFTLVRQEMLNQTDSDWFIILDGDEVWWEDSIKEVVDTINKKGNKAESFIVRMIYPIGDIYHRQEEAAGMYELAGKKGHVSLRAVNRRIPGLTSLRPHGTQGWIDENGVVVYIAENALPESYPALFGSNVESKYVLEVVSGFAKRHGVITGSKVEFK